MGDKQKRPLMVSMITWGEWMDDSTDDIRVAECINDALKSLPSNILDKISKIVISR